MAKIPTHQDEKLGWILVHSVKKYESENSTPMDELAERFEPDCLWQWSRGKPMKEDLQPRTLLLAWKGRVFGEATVTITRKVIDEGYNFAFVLKKYRRLKKSIPFSKLKLGSLAENARDLIKLTPAVVAAYEKAAGAEVLSDGSEIDPLIEKLVNPAKMRRGQGYGLTGKERKCVELRGMKLANKYLKAKGFIVRDVSDSESFDFEAKKAGKTVLVEVKATMGEGKEILVTKNEVELHQKNHPDNMLIVVSGIELDRSTPNQPTASGGKVLAVHPWKLNIARLTPMAYSYVL